MTEPKRIKHLFETLLKAEMHYFPAFGKLNITCDKGSYIIYSPAGIVSHVGNTPRGLKGLCQRLNNHIEGNSSYAREFLKPRGLSVRDGYSFRLLEVPSARERMLLQALATGELCPEHIGTHEKVE